jgi:hypothetical protein
MNPQASWWLKMRQPSSVGMILLAISVWHSGCSWDDLDLPSDDGDSPAVASIALTPAALELGGVGDSAQLGAAAYDRLGAPVENQLFQWSVSDSTIAAVDTAGRIRALGLGTITAAASIDGVEGTATVEIDPSFALERACGQCHSQLVGDHVDLGFSPVSCWLCHNPAGETHTQFQNNHMIAAGGFELLGVHVGIRCSSCHVRAGNGVRFSPSDFYDCVACHQSDYDAEHGGSSFPTTCTSCHTPTTWSGATIDHGAVSGGFDLLGVHANLACTSCHVPGSYVPLFSPADESDCIACHQSDYDAQHAGSGYPTTCLSCHDGTVWTGATFDHSVASGGYDLLGPHTTLICTDCHDATTGQPLFSPVDESDCIACHQSDYDRQHVGSGYPTTCLSCHDGTVWTGASFNHDADFFPILSGKHDGEWQSCTTCHTQSANFAEFTCFNCHKHNQNDMDDKHSGMTGYAYDSATCLGCHPDGSKP